jgi:cell division protein FtsN
MPRDYKNNKRRPATSSGMGAGSGFVLGLALGLSLALGIFIYDRRTAQSEKTTQQQPPVKRPASPAAPPPASPPADRQYDFYDMLPKFEVVIPEQDESTPVQARSVAMQKPGVYMLQAGSFRDSADAERVRALIALQGVQSKVQRVAIDRDTWHRVRIGPITNLKELEATRSKLRQAQIEALVIRIGG